MSNYLGVDWAGGCWVVVKTGDTTHISTEPSILNVWHQHGTDVRSILIDIPIGLPESDVRSCDTEASERLAGRRSTVFSIPSREVVETNDYERARELNGDSLGSQSWWLFPRIREVDVFLQEHSDAVDKVYESHPEVCFSELTSHSLRPKDTREGRRERLQVFDEASHLYDEVTKIVRDRDEGAEWHERISKRRLVDVVDAAVLAYTAKRLDLGPRSEESIYPALPTETTEEDEFLRVPMEIIHPGR